MPNESSVLTWVVSLIKVAWSCQTSETKQGQSWYVFGLKTTEEVSNGSLTQLIQSQNIQIHILDSPWIPEFYNYLFDILFFWLV